MIRFALDLALVLALALAVVFGFVVSVLVFFVALEAVLETRPDIVVGLVVVFAMFVVKDFVDRKKAQSW